MDTFTKILFCVATGMLIGFSIGYAANHHRLSYAERQAIAIDFMCSPQQHWKGMKSFCGAQVLDSKGN